MKPLNCIQQVTGKQICILMNGNICDFSFTFIVQMIRTLLFVNQFLQVWYQNEEDIHLLPMKCFYFP